MGISVPGGATLNWGSSVKLNSLLLVPLVPSFPVSHSCPSGSSLFPLLLPRSFDPVLLPSGFSALLVPFFASIESTVVPSSSSPLTTLVRLRLRLPRCPDSALVPVLDRYRLWLMRGAGLSLPAPLCMSPLIILMFADEGGSAYPSVVISADIEPSSPSRPVQKCSRDVLREGHSVERASSLTAASRME